KIAQIGIAHKPQQGENHHGNKGLEQSCHCRPASFSLLFGACRHPSGGGAAAIIYGILGKFTPLRKSESTLRGPLPAASVGDRGTEVRFRLRKSVVLVGMMGAGKTAVGTALARRLGVPFLDSDEQIEKAA